MIEEQKSFDSDSHDLLGLEAKDRSGREPRYGNAAARFAGQIEIENARAKRKIGPSTILPPIIHLNATSSPTSPTKESKFGEILGTRSYNESVGLGDLDSSEKQVQIAHDTDEDFEHEAARSPDSRRQQTFPRRDPNQLSKENLMNMDSKKLLAILRDLNHVTDMEEFGAAVNMIRQSIIQLGDEAGLPAQMALGLQSATPQDHLEDAMQAVMEQSEHQNVIRNNITVVDYTNYIRKTTDRAGRFQHLVNESKLPGVKRARMYYHNEDVSNRQLQDLQINSTYVEGNLRHRGLREPPHDPATEKGTLKIKLDENVKIR